jgi:hypothetical protein
VRNASAPPASALARCDASSGGIPQA